MQHFYEIDYGAFGGKLDVLMEVGRSDSIQKEQNEMK